MKNEQVSFYSEGAKVKGILRLPDERSECEPDRAKPSIDETVSGRRPAIVQGPGWLGLMDSKLYER